MDAKVVVVPKACLPTENVSGTDYKCAIFMLGKRGIVLSAYF